MFSIVIPLYNKEQYIEKTIESVLNQSFNAFELIIIDDGSTDSGLVKVKKIKDRRIRIIEQENKGVSCARNLGIKESRNKFIAFLDADDQWNKDFLLTISEMIQEFPKATVFFTDYTNKKNKIDNLSKQKQYFILIDDYFLFSKQFVSITNSSVVVEKNALLTAGLYNDKLSRGEDLLLWTQLAIKNKMIYSPYIGAFYNREVKFSLTRTNQPLNKSFSNFAEEFYLTNVDKVVNKVTFKHYMSDIIITKAKYLSKLGKKNEARELLNKYIYKGNRQKVNLMKLITYLPQTAINLIYK